MKWVPVAVWLSSAVSTAGLAAVGYELARPPGPARAMPIEQVPSSRHDANPWARWTVTEQLSAHHVLIVQVETRHLNDARAIARIIVDPIIPKDNYAEVLVYFHRPGRPDVLAPRRVQWTPTGGYVETIY